MAKRSDAARGGGKYCSRACWRRAPQSAEANERRRAAMADRKGEKNPNYRHGDRVGEHSRNGKDRFRSGQTTCQAPNCPGTASRLHEHHVVYRQHVRNARGDEWDPRDALRLCVSCHTAHHRGGKRRLPVSALRQENIDFAFDLLGAAAFDYFGRYYQDDGTRLTEALASYYPEEGP